MAIQHCPECDRLMSNFFAGKMCLPCKVTLAHADYWFLKWAGIERDLRWIKKKGRLIQDPWKSKSPR